jgi:multicomponent Na+:H+ antiporter subunit E
VNLFVANLLLALVWGAMTGSFTLTNLLFGFVLGYLVLLAAGRILGPSRYHSRILKVFAFLGFYLVEVIMANLRVAYDVVTPAFRTRPGIIAVPLEAKTDLEITLLANLVTMTPGTLSIDVSADRKTLYVHAMFVDDPDVFRDELKRGLERRVLEILR